jgi:hypothetical protein
VTGTQYVHTPEPSNAPASHVIRPPQYPPGPAQSPDDPHPHAPPPVTGSHFGPGSQKPQLLHAPPLLPHSFGMVPIAHMKEALQQPPLHVMGGKPPGLQPGMQLPFDWQAMLTGQSEEVTHAVQLPVWQTGDIPMHVVHVPPSAPQLAGAVPPWQCPPMSQHPPLHGDPGLHTFVHKFIALHALPGSHSLAFTQPHMPLGRHAEPLLGHVKTHMPVEQQAPLQGEAPLQVVPHVPPLHALPGRQSFCETQPQVPPARHWLPFSPAHEVQALPSTPHAVGALPIAQVPALQQPPLQGDLALQLAPQTLAVHA